MTILQPGDKYAMVAVVNTAKDPALRLPLQLSDTVEILGELPIEVAQHWREWLGTITFDNLSRCNLAIVVRMVSANLPVVDAENGQLREKARSILYGLLLNGIPYSNGIHFLSGSIYRDQPPDVRQHAKEEFVVGPDRSGVFVTESNLRDALPLGENILAFQALPRNPSPPRARIGFHALIQAILARWGEDRLHLFVRAIEGLAKSPPPSGQNFVERVSSAMVTDNQDNRQALDDIYKLRNAIEHLNPLDDVPRRIADANARRELRTRMVRQAEDLALRVYRRLFTDRAFMTSLATDAGIDALWALSPADRRVRWADSIDLMATI